MEAQAVSMQREMDEQKEQYEKKIRHVESVNTALSSQVLDIQNQLDNLANANDLKRIQEYISGHEVVEKYKLASIIIGYYKEDVKKDDFEGVTTDYIDELIMQARNFVVAKGMIQPIDEIYNDDLWKEIKTEIDIYSQDIIYNLGYEFSKSQIKKLNDKLDDYASDLWKNKKKANMYDVENIVNSIAIR